MKYVVLVGDGMADYPIESLGGKTALMSARTPNMDRMAKHGELGLAKTIPDGMVPGSEIANLAIMGYDPARYFTGRGPLEAASLGVKIGEEDLAFRCNLVTLQNRDSNVFMQDFAAGHIRDAEAKEIILELDKKMGFGELQFFPGVSYRHLMVWRGGAARFPSLEGLELTPPHDIIGKEISPHLPAREAGGRENGGEKIIAFMKRSQDLLRNHPVNVAREKRRELPANSIWLWGQGRSPRMKPLRERYGIEGYMISAVHLLKGIGMLAGLEVLDVPGATGYFDTNYAGKAEYALKGLQTRDLVYVHVEAPDEAGHMGDPRLKVECIEAFDEKVVGPILEGVASFDRFKVLVMPDHPTPVSIRTHTADPIPFAIYSGGRREPPAGVTGFDEASAGRTGIFIEKGYELIGKFLT